MSKLSKEAIAAINMTLSLMETNTSQASLGKRLKVDQSTMSGFIRALRAHGAKIPQKAAGGRPAKKKITRATTTSRSTPIARTAKRSNGVHANH